MRAGWFFVLASSALNVAWLVSLRNASGFQRVLPLVGVAVFGITSTYCLSRALAVMPTSIAYAVYMGITVAGSVALDVFVLRQPLAGVRLGLVIMIIIATLGLQATTGAATRPGELQVTANSHE